MQPGAAAWRALELELPVERVDTVGETPQAGAARRVGAARPSSIDVDDRVGRRVPRPDATREACAYLATFASASETTK